MSGSNSTFPHYGPGDTISPRTANRLFRIITNARGLNGITVKVKDSGLEIGGSEGLNLALFPFGWDGTSEDGLRAKILAGYVSFRGGFGNVAEREVSVGGTLLAPHFIVAEGTTAHDGTILAASVDALSFTGHTPDKWRVPLYLAYNQDGTPTLLKILHLGTIELGGSS